MSRRLALVLLVLSGCALRSRYEELNTRFVPHDSPRSEVLIQVVDGNDVPVPGARIEIGDRVRFKATTDDDGIFRLPLDKKYQDENALVVVVLPRGVKSYKFVDPVSHSETMRQPPLLPSDVSGAGDAGVTTM